MSHKTCIIWRGKNPPLSIYKTEFHLRGERPGICVSCYQFLQNVLEAPMRPVLNVWSDCGLRLELSGEWGLPSTPPLPHLCFCIHTRSHTHNMAWAAGQAKCIDCRKAEWHLGAPFGWTILICSVQLQCRGIDYLTVVHGR